MNEVEFRERLSAKSQGYAQLFSQADAPGIVSQTAEAVGQAKPVALPVCSNLGVGTGCQTRRCNKGHGGRIKEGCQRCNCPPGHGRDAGVKPCEDCGPQCKDYETEDGTEFQHLIVIELGAGGIGDGLLASTAVAQLREDHPEARIRFQLSRTAQPFVALFDVCHEFGPNVKSHSEEPVKGAIQANLNHNAEARAKIRIPRWKRYARNIGASGNKIPALRNPEEVRALGSEFAGFVMLCPFSTDKQREWSVQHWLMLESLLTKAGYKTAVVHHEPKRLAPFIRSKKLAGVTAETLAGAFLNAAWIVGSDSGPAHLAGILGAKTIVLGGGTPVAQIFGLYPAVTCIQGGLECSACCGGKPSDERCHQSCGNLQSIEPREVFAAMFGKDCGKVALPVYAEQLAGDGPEVRRLDMLSELNPFRAFNPEDMEKTLRHLNEDAWLYEPGKHRYICSILGAVHQEIAKDRKLEKAAELVLEAAWMARIMNDRPGGRQEDIDWHGRNTIERVITGGRSLLNPTKLHALRDFVLATNHLPGDVAELGVFTGGSAKLIGHYAPNKPLHLFDTFEGIPENDRHGKHKRGDFPAEFLDVLKFLDNPLAVFHRGKFPEVLPPEGTAFAFVHVDADIYQSTLAAIDYFGPRMVPGGLMIFDDFRWHMCPGVEKALRERLPAERIQAEHGQAIIRF